MENSGLIHKQMVAILRDTGAIGKDMRNSVQGFNFRGIDQVYNDLHGVFAQHGVYICPSVVEHRHFEETTAKGSKMHHHFVTMDFTFVAEDGSFTVMRGLGEAADSGDKGVNKCMSIALKYALFQSLLIPTAEDKDPDASGYTTGGRTRKQEVEEGKRAAAEVRDQKLAGMRPQSVQPPKGKASFKALEAFGTMKKALGDTAYYMILGQFGNSEGQRYTKSNQIESDDQAREIYKAMALYQKGDPETDPALFDTGKPEANAALNDHIGGKR